MFNEMNPVTKQLWIFSFLVSLIICALINFIAVELLKGSFLYGWPFNLNNTFGLGSFFARVGNTLVLGLILTPVCYYTVKYLQTRVRV
jgi:hypothetical protein